MPSDSSAIRSDRSIFGWCRVASNRSSTTVTLLRTPSKASLTTASNLACPFRKSSSASRHTDVDGIGEHTDQAHRKVQVSICSRYIGAEAVVKLPRTDRALLSRNNLGAMSGLVYSVSTPRNNASESLLTAKIGRRNEQSTDDRR